MPKIYEEKESPMQQMLTRYAKRRSAQGRTSDLWTRRSNARDIERIPKDKYTNEIPDRPKTPNPNLPSRGIDHPPITGKDKTDTSKPTGSLGGTHPLPKPPQAVPADPPNPPSTGGGYETIQDLTGGYTGSTGMTHPLPKARPNMPYTQPKIR